MEQDANDLKSNIRALEAQIKGVKYQVQRLDNELDLIRPILSPIRRVPPEILGEIFASIPADKHPLSPIRTYQSTLCTLCLVCKAWKDAAQSLPRLWSNLNVELTEVGPRLTPEKLKIWSSRAKDTRKALSVRASGCDPYSHGSWNSWQGWHGGVGRCVYQSHAIASIMKDGPLLDSVFFRFASAGCFQFFSAVVRSLRGPSGPYISSSISSLSLDLRLWKDWVDEPDQSLLSMAPPSMTTLKVLLPTSHQAPYEDDALGILLNAPGTLKDLTTLGLSGNMSAAHIFKLLQRCASLRQLMLDLCMGEFNNWNDEPFMLHISQVGLTLPQLASLELRQVPLEALGGLSLLRCPRLRELSIMFGKVGWQMGSEDVGYNDVFGRRVGSRFAAFLRGDTTSDSTLESLRIEHGIFEEDTLFKSLQPLSSITDLTLVNVAFSPDLFTKLSTPTMHLPQLRVLTTLSLPLQENRFQSIQQIRGFAQEQGVELWMSQDMWAIGTPTVSFKLVKCLLTRGSSASESHILGDLEGDDSDQDV
jgi:hypothetical protein